jgi:hypothetical protein
VQTLFTARPRTFAFLPVISEMRRPKVYNKALYLSMGIATVTYLTFGLVIHYHCGKWVATPSFSSAGPVIMKVAYGIGLIGLLVTACLWIHVYAKYVRVRVLRNSRHLLVNTIVQFGNCSLGLTAISLVIAAGVSNSIIFSALSVALNLHLLRSCFQHNYGCMTTVHIALDHWLRKCSTGFIADAFSRSIHDCRRNIWRYSV